ncbi:hypothetical protein DNTS_020392 [Danionella cerebrum]|uniref:Uncharacterized protein n=1 Tax=Danionella cerebrum TaxID=2873325 RepID=A0A553QM70_9TELE|nr:hypothetical protein DNTS_020392 [Danionella translucida]
MSEKQASTSSRSQNKHIQELRLQAFPEGPQECWVRSPDVHPSPVTKRRVSSFSVMHDEEQKWKQNDGASAPSTAELHMNHTNGPENLHFLYGTLKELKKHPGGKERVLIEAKKTLLVSDGVRNEPLTLPETKPRMSHAPNVQSLSLTSTVGDRTAILSPTEGTLNTPHVSVGFHQCCGFLPHT